MISFRFFKPFCELKVPSVTLPWVSTAGLRVRVSWLRDGWRVSVTLPWVSTDGLRVRVSWLLDGLRVDGLRVRVRVLRRLLPAFRVFLTIETSLELMGRVQKHLSLKTVGSNEVLRKI